MSGGVRLDLDPTAKFPNKYGISRYENNEITGGYTSYKYEKSGEGSQPFTLSVLLFEGKPLPGILSYPISVTSVVTFYDEGKKNLLLIDILISGTHIYYLNPDTSSEPVKVTFTKFAPKDSKEVGNSDLTKILQDIIQHSGFNINELGKQTRNVAKSLLGDNGIIFDLTQQPNKRNIPKSKTYGSELINAEVIVTDDGKIKGIYHKVQHVLSSLPFYIKGIKLQNGAYMKVKGGFPNDPLTGFIVYYKDGHYEDAFLVTLKVSFSGLNLVPSRYYLTKTNKEGTEQWEIRKVGLHLEDPEILEVLRDISLHDELKLQAHGDKKIKKKLYDISKGLPIDLTLTTDNAIKITKYYESDEAIIPYQKEGKRDNYWIIEHANKIPSFSVKSIKISKKVSIKTNDLPPEGTIFEKLNAYYADNSYKNLVLMELTCLYDTDHNTEGLYRYVYYYSTPDNGNTWQGYLLSTTVGESNGVMGNVIKHVIERSRIDLDNLGSYQSSLENKLVEYPTDLSPKVTLDISKSDGNPSYTPDGRNSTPFNVKMTKVSSEFYQFTHTAKGNVSFRVKNVVHTEGKTLNDVRSDGHIASLSAFYWGESPSYDHLLLIQIGEDNQYYTWSSSYNWDKTSGSEDVTKILNRQNCMRRKYHIIDISQKTNPYECPSCNKKIQVALTEDVVGYNYTRYAHYISGNENFSVSYLIDAGTRQTNPPPVKNVIKVWVFWYPKNGNPKPLLIFYDKDVNMDHEEKWFKKTKANEWEEVLDKDKKPSYENDYPRIRELLKEELEKLKKLSDERNQLHKSNGSGLPPAVRKGLKIGGGVSGTIGTGIVGFGTWKLWSKIMSFLITRL
ncbi:hypothetical protein BEWA_004770 [Theileria equi strain WA]|uniref:Uncharacterized protein n=1 Tax=Theileria equi strain WA TaxID=1537102 RepID=L0B1R3_THEEQ|nr:hypothetical protein BEWA_004770 [Theileria equi strain WA]AFZ81069.1 hypothetical protein BEWA_004770 [Theileria equi strain WA]|eukprot:XP_004830735.1 hypothetical protein BEWA_004770 [Theileria equi strain WA]